jgi:hypothetical protein
MRTRLNRQGFMYRPNKRLGKLVELCRAMERNPTQVVDVLIDSAFVEVEKMKKEMEKKQNADNDTDSTSA